MNKYFDFYGCSSRSDFWAVQLIVALIAIVVLLIETSFSMIFPIDMQSGILGLMMFPTLVVVIIIQWAALIRRLRDANINPWFSLCTVIPYIGLIVFIIFGCIPTENK